MAKKFQLAVVGAGMWGKNHIDMFQKEGRSEVRWVCDINPAVTAAACAKFGIERSTQDFQQVLDDPAVDAVVVAAPPYMHVPIGLEVLKAGKHLLIEKPMAVSDAEAQALVEAAQQHPNQVVLEGSCRHARLNPKFAFLKKFIESGVLGEVYYVHHRALGQGTYVEYNPKGTWAMDKRYAGGGPFVDWGEYDLSFHLGILGDRPMLQGVQSFTRSGLRDLSHMAPVVDVEMHGAAYLHFDGGLTYYYERGAGVHGESSNETRVYGTKGGLCFRYTSWEPNTIEYFHDGEKPVKETLTVDMSGHPSNDNTPFVAHFIDCLEGKAQPMMSPALAAKHLHILFAVLGKG